MATIRQPNTPGSNESKSQFVNRVMRDLMTKGHTQANARQSAETLWQRHISTSSSQFVADSGTPVTRTSGLTPGGARPIIYKAPPMRTTQQRPTATASASGPPPPLEQNVVQKANASNVLSPMQIQPNFDYERQSQKEHELAQKEYRSYAKDRERYSKMMNNNLFKYSFLYTMPYYMRNASVPFTSAKKFGKEMRQPTWAEWDNPIYQRIWHGKQFAPQQISKKFAQTGGDWSNALGLGQNVGQKIGKGAAYPFEFANQLPITSALKLTPGIMTAMSLGNTSRKMSHYQSRKEDYGPWGGVVRGANALSMGRRLISSPAAALYPFLGLPGFGTMARTALGSSIGGPLALTAALGPSIAGMFGEHFAQKYRQKTRGTRLVASKVDRQFDKLPGVESAIDRAMQSLSPYEYMSLKLMRIVGLNTGSISDTHAILKHYVEDAQTKDTGTASDLYHKHTRDKSKDYKGLISGIKDALSEGFNKTVGGIHKFSTKYNPIQQLGDFINYGKTPRERLRELDDLYGKDAKKKDQENLIRKQMSQTGRSYAPLKLLMTTSKSLSRMADSFQGKNITLLSGLYDINREQLRVLMDIQEHGIGRKRPGPGPLGSPTPPPENLAWYHGIPGVSAFMNLYSAGKKLVHPVKNLQSWVERRSLRKINKLEEKYGDKYSELNDPLSKYSKDPSDLLKAAGIKGLGKSDQVFKVQTQIIPDKFEELISLQRENIDISKQMWEILRDIFHTLSGEVKDFRDYKKDIKKYDAFSGKYRGEVDYFTEQEKRRQTLKKHLKGEIDKAGRKKIFKLRNKERSNLGYNQSLDENDLVEAALGMTIDPNETGNVLDRFEKAKTSHKKELSRRMGLQFRYGGDRDFYWTKGQMRREVVSKMGKGPGVNFGHITDEYSPAEHDKANIGNLQGRHLQIGNQYAQKVILVGVDKKAIDDMHQNYFTIRVVSPGQRIGDDCLKIATCCSTGKCSENGTTRPHPTSKALGSSLFSDEQHKIVVVNVSDANASSKLMLPSGKPLLALPPGSASKVTDVKSEINEINKEKKEKEELTWKQTVVKKLSQLVGYEKEESDDFKQLLKKKFGKGDDDEKGGLFSKLFGGLGKIFGLLGGLGGIGKLLKFGAILYGAFQLADKTVVRIVRWFANVGDVLKRIEKVSETIKGAANVGEAVGEGVKGASLAGKAVSFAKNGIQAFNETKVGKTIAKAGNYVVDTAVNAGKWVNNKTGGLWDLVSEVASKIGNKIKSFVQPIKTMYNTLKNCKLVSKAKPILAALAKKISGVFETIRGFEAGAKLLKWIGIFDIVINLYNLVQDFRKDDSSLLLKILDVLAVLGSACNTKLVMGALCFVAGAVTVGVSCGLVIAISLIGIAASFWASHIRDGKEKVDENEKPKEQSAADAMKAGKGYNPSEDDINPMVPVPNENGSPNTLPSGPPKVDTNAQAVAPGQTPNVPQVPQSSHGSPDQAPTMDYGGLVHGRTNDDHQDTRLQKGEYVFTKRETSSMINSLDKMTSLLLKMFDQISEMKIDLSKIHEIKVWEQQRLKDQDARNAANNSMGDVLTQMQDGAKNIWGNIKSGVGKVANMLGFGGSNKMSAADIPNGKDFFGTGTPGVLQNLGDLSAKYESRGSSSAVGWDARGLGSYGKYQIATGTGTMDQFLKYLSDKDPELAKQLIANKADMREQNGKFASTWKDLANSGKLKNYEHDFIKQTHFDAGFQKLSPELQKLVKSDPDLQQLLWARTVHHGAGGGSNIFNEAFNQVGGGDKKALVKAIYGIADTRLGDHDAKTMLSLHARMKNEQADLLGSMSARERAAAMQAAGYSASGGSGGVVFPLSQQIVNSPMGERNIPNGSHNHKGNDYRGAMGDPVKAVMGGKVIDNKAGALTIQHDDGTIAVYRHMPLNADLKVGQTIQAGQMIGQVGDVSRNGNKIAPHLHLEMKTKDGQFINPDDFFKQRLGGEYNPQYNFKDAEARNSAASKLGATIPQVQPDNNSQNASQVPGGKILEKFGIPATAPAESGGFATGDAPVSVTNLGRGVQEAFLPLNNDRSMKTIGESVGQYISQSTGFGKLNDANLNAAQQMSASVDKLIASLGELNKNRMVDNSQNRLGNITETTQQLSNISTSLDANKQYSPKTQTNQYNQPVPYNPVGIPTAIPIMANPHSDPAAMAELQTRKVDHVSASLIEQIFANTIISFQQATTMYAIGQHPFSVYHVGV